MTRPTFPAAPSRVIGRTVCAVLVVVWGLIRLVVFDTVMFPLTYALPLLVNVWTRDRLALWSMALIFMGFHTAKIFWLVAPGTLTPDERWANYLATLVNVTATSIAIEWILRLRDRLDAHVAQVTAQREELRAQAEELTSQNEELAQQAEELSQQSEELASQNEELQTQAGHIGNLNEELTRREALLQTLLDATRISGSETGALQQICDAALHLVGDMSGVAAAYERTSGGLVLRAAASHIEGFDATHMAAADDFVRFVIGSGRTAALDDARLRPDAAMCELPGVTFRAVLCAPMTSPGGAVGALAVYVRPPHAWTAAQFRLADWLAGQAAHVLETLRMQEALRESDRRKGEFLATLSHELRNPLAPIRYAVELLGKPGSPQGLDLKAIIDRQLRHLVRLVDDLLEATRLSSNKVRLEKRRVGLSTVVQHAVEAVGPEIERAGHTLTVSLPDQEVWLDADPDRLAQVVTNLLNNSVRYTPSGGHITLDAGLDGSELHLTVTDSGVGLAHEDLDRVFDMFAQVGGAGSGGLGIGLALVKGIVELHGGRVEARSDGPGRGATFHVTLPAASAGTSHQAAAPGSAVPASERRRILVVDDNVDSAEMMAMLLEMHGHDVRMAHDGRTALATAREFEPHIGLLDIGLPGIDGYQVARSLRSDASTRHMHLVAVTGWGHETDRERARAAGFDAHLTKPAAPDRILEVVARAGRGGVELA